MTSILVNIVIVMIKHVASCKIGKLLFHLDEVNFGYFSIQIWSLNVNFNPLPTGLPAISILPGGGAIWPPFQNQAILVPNSKISIHIPKYSQEWLMDKVWFLGSKSRALWRALKFCPKSHFVTSSLCKNPKLFFSRPFLGASNRSDWTY